MITKEIQDNEEKMMESITYQQNEEMMEEAMKYLEYDEKMIEITIREKKNPKNEITVDVTANQTLSILTALNTTESEKYMGYRQDVNINEFFRGIIVTEKEQEFIIQELYSEKIKKPTKLVSRDREFIMDANSRCLYINIRGTKVEIKKATDEQIKSIFKPDFNQCFCYMLHIASREGYINGKIHINYKDYMKARNTTNKPAKSTLESFCKALDNISIHIPITIKKKESYKILKVSQDSYYQDGVAFIHLGEEFNKHFQYMKQSAYIHRSLLKINHKWLPHTWNLSRYIYELCRIKKNDMEVVTDGDKKYHKFKVSATSLLDNTRLIIPKDKRRYQEYIWDPLNKNLSAIGELTKGDLTVSLAQYSSTIEKDCNKWKTYYYEVRVYEAELLKILNELSEKEKKKIETDKKRVEKAKLLIEKQKQKKKSKENLNAIK